MALILNTRVQETTTTTGTGSITLLGAVAQFQSFASGIGDGNSTNYTIADQSGTNWEMGIGTFSASGNTLSRTAVTSSSNSGSLVNFTAGTKNVFCTYGAKSAVLSAAYSYPAVTPALYLDFLNTTKLDPRITFTRPTANSTTVGTATYYDGKTTALADQNLFLYSNFDSISAWPGLTANNTFVANQIASPIDNTTIAGNLLIPSVTTGVHAFYQTAGVSSANQTISIYVQSAGYSNFQIFDILGGAYNATFDLVANTATNVIGCSAVSISNITSTNWYRCTATMTAPSNTTIGFQAYPNTGVTASNTGNIFTGDGTSGVYIYGSQLEQRTLATAYTPTTSSTVSNYISVLITAAANTPRFDYNPTTAKPLGLLIEESRTNLITTSTTPFPAIGSSPANTVVTTSTTETLVLPDGSIGPCSKVFFNAVSPQDCRARMIISGNTTPFSASVYYKIPGITSGWKLFTSVNNTSGVSYTYLEINASGFDGNVLYGKTVYFTFGQIEAGISSSSYIPTTGSAVTRTADTATITGNNFSSWYNPGQGTYYIESEMPASSASNPVVVPRFLSHNNRSIEVSASGNNYLQTYSLYTPYPNGGGFSTSPIAFSVGSALKFATTYSNANNTLSLNVNGLNFSVVNNFYSLQTNAATSLGIGYQVSATTRYLNAHIRKIVYYPTALSTTNIQALTTQ